MAMTDTDPAPLGGEGKVVEADETYIGRSGDPKDTEFISGKGWQRKGGDDKMIVMTLVERGGKARSVHIDRATSAELNKVLIAKADPQGRLMTDDAKAYRGPGKRFASHETVNHSAEEYVRGDVHTNTVEGYYSIFKRGMKGVYQHCTDKHLHRYLAEFDFRYSHRIKLGIDDTTRAMLAIRGAEGKRLTYRRTRQPTALQAARARRQTAQARRAAYRAAGIRVYRPDC